MASYEVEQLWTPFAETLLDWDDAFHDLMLDDKLRMTAYRKAIFEVVKPGDIVLDVGTGTGILSKWALEAGAKRVIGIEMNKDILAEAIKQIAYAGFSERFEPINEISFKVELASPVDVLISEIMGNMADNEDFQPILQDAIKRLLKPGGVVLPRTTSSYLVPVSAQKAHSDLGVGKVRSLTPRYDIKRLYQDKDIKSPFNLYYDCIVPRASYVAEPLLVCAYRDEWQQATTYTKELSFDIEREGRFTGFKGYFVAELSESTVLDISGDDIDGGTTSSSWKHVYLPIEHAIDVQPGDNLQLTFSRSYPIGGTAFRQIYRWSGEILRAGGVVGCFDQCMKSS